MELLAETMYMALDRSELGQFNCKNLWIDFKNLHLTFKLYMYKEMESYTFNGISW